MTGTYIQPSKIWMLQCLHGHMIKIQALDSLPAFTIIGIVQLVPSALLAVLHSTAPHHHCFVLCCSYSPLFLHPIVLCSILLAPTTDLHHLLPPMAEEVCSVWAFARQLLAMWGFLLEASWSLGSSVVRENKCQLGAIGAVGCRASCTCFQPWQQQA